jgi:protein-disulfide isomerase
MKMRALLLVITILLLAHTASSQQKAPAAAPSASTTQSAASSPSTADLPKRIEDFLRKLYAWGPEFQIKIAPIGAATKANLYEVPVEVTFNGMSDTAVIYVSKDGRYIFRGDVQQLTADPLASIRQQLHLEGYGSKGPANAKVVLVEFADFECPSCRQLDSLLREVLPKYPQVRLVFKDFPLEQVHPWAMTAAIAGHCALQKSQDAFWSFHDAVYDNQDMITADNAFSKLNDLAKAAGVDPTTFGACMTDPKTRQTVEKSIAEGKALNINSTPTTFVDGRQFVGPDPNSLQQYIEYDQGTKQ